MRPYWSEPCRTIFPLRLMYRLLKVSPSEYDARQSRSSNLCTQECQRLTTTISTIHSESDGVHGSLKIWQVLPRQDARGGKHRMARLMRQEGLHGIPAPKRWKRRRAGEGPAGITNQVTRDFFRPWTEGQMGDRHHLFRHRKVDSTWRSCWMCFLGQSSAGRCSPSSPVTWSSKPC